MSSYKSLEAKILRMASSDPSLRRELKAALSSRSDSRGGDPARAYMDQRTLIPDLLNRIQKKLKQLDQREPNWTMVTYTRQARESLEMVYRALISASR